MLSGDEFYPDEVTSGPATDELDGCPACGRDLERLGGNPDCEVCAAEPAPRPAAYDTALPQAWWEEVFRATGASPTGHVVWSYDPPAGTFGAPVALDAEGRRLLAALAEARRLDYYRSQPGDHPPAVCAAAREAGLDEGWHAGWGICAGRVAAPCAGCGWAGGDHAVDCPRYVAEQASRHRP